METPSRKAPGRSPPSTTPSIRALRLFTVCENVQSAAPLHPDAVCLICLMEGTDAFWVKVSLVNHFLLLLEVLPASCSDFKDDKQPRCVYGWR